MAAAEKEEKRFSNYLRVKALTTMATNEQVVVAIEERQKAHVQYLCGG